MSTPRHFSARFSLLDHQLLDCHGLPIGRVDDAELDVSGADAPPRVTALLTGAEALGQRLGGLVGGLMSHGAARLRDPEDARGPVKLDPELIAELEPLIKLRVGFADLPHVGGLERWLGRHFVGRLPGTGDAA